MKTVGSNSMNIECICIFKYFKVCLKTKSKTVCETDNSTYFWDIDCYMGMLGWRVVEIITRRMGSYFCIWNFHKDGYILIL